MSLVRVDPDDRSAVECLTSVMNAARVVDDPQDHPTRSEIENGYLRFGWGLELAETSLYVPDGGGEPVGFLKVDLPRRDNRHLAWVEGAVHPDHRRQGHGTAMLSLLTDRVRSAGRTTIWAGGLAGYAPTLSFLEGAGFRRASGDARRRQRLADVDWAAVDRLDAAAVPAAADYELERSRAPTSDVVLAELVEVTAAINDAPMGELDYEDEVFDVERLRDIESAAAGRGDLFYRVVARHRGTGEVGGHTQVIFTPHRPHDASIGDTAVARSHRGHRLGLRLKIDMMRWLAEVQPQLETVETWNNVDNHHMISINEQLGYRLAGTFTTYELTLT
ncbi:MAG: GNAT family N-acetyltransferase [Propionibacteriaceae bacterium]